MAERLNAAVLPAGGGSAFGGKTFLKLMACTYLIFSNSANHFYIGSTKEIDSKRRLTSHNHGKTKSTKSGRPWQLIFEEQYISYTEARKREIFLKSGVGRRWIAEKYGDLKSLGKA